MQPSQPSICPTCHSPIPADAPGGLCPQCLMQAALGTGVDAGPDTQAGSRPSFTAPPPEELARFFPQLEILELLGRGGIDLLDCSINTGDKRGTVDTPCIELSPDGADEVARGGQWLVEVMRKRRRHFAGKRHPRGLIERRLTLLQMAIRLIELGDHGDHLGEAGHHGVAGGVHGLVRGQGHGHARGGGSLLATEIGDDYRHGASIGG